MAEPPGPIIVSVVTALLVLALSIPSIRSLWKFNRLYPGPPLPVDQAIRWVRMRLENSSQSFRSFRLAMTDHGLHLVAIWPCSYFQRPLFFPWSEITACQRIPSKVLLLLGGIRIHLVRWPHPVVMIAARSRDEVFAAEFETE